MPTFRALFGLVVGVVAALGCAAPAETSETASSELSACASTARILPAAKTASLETWSHAVTYPSATGPTPTNAVRASTGYRATVATAKQPCDLFRSFTYASVPRGGHPKRGYTTSDGADFAVSAGLTMSWTSFLYREDAIVRVEITKPLPRPLTPDQVVIRPLSLKLQPRIVGDHTIEVTVPYRRDGVRFSVELESDLYTSYSTIDTTQPVTWQGDLTTKKTANPVHTEPRNGMLVFAEPMLDAAEASELVPDEQRDAERIAYPAQGDLSRLHETTAEILYFRPGIYTMPATYHARLAPSVRWIYLAPGAFVKGAFEFAEGVPALKLTGFGVLAGDDYIYEADSSTNPPYRRRVTGGPDAHVVRMINVHSDGMNRRLRVHGVTLTGLPFWAFGLAGNEETFAVSIDHYKQVGGWYYQTDGFEPKRGASTLADASFEGEGRLTHSFIHNNDDTLKLYDSRLRVDDVVVWKAENGPVAQIGWWPRNIHDTRVSNVKVIHNRLHWNCVIDSERNNSDWHREHGMSSDPAKTIENVTFENFEVEGSVKCAFMFDILSNVKGMTIRNFAVERWNGLPYNLQASRIRTIKNAAGAQVKVARYASETDFGIRFEHYTVGGVEVTFAADNWRDHQLGRLAIDADLWGTWLAR